MDRSVAVAVEPVQAIQLRGRADDGPRGCPLGDEHLGLTFEQGGSTPCVADVRRGRAGDRQVRSGR